MSDTKEVRAVLNTDTDKEELVRIALLLCSELDALRKPVVTPERPPYVETFLKLTAECGPWKRGQMSTYILALEAQNRRLRGDLRTALECYRDETDTMLTVRDKEIAEIEARHGGKP